MNNKNTAEIYSLPNCNLCLNNTACFDAKLGGRSAWAYVCQNCFNLNDCKLGLGLGQRLLEVK